MLGFIKKIFKCISYNKMSIECIICIKFKLPTQLKKNECVSKVFFQSWIQKCLPLLRFGFHIVRPEDERFPSSWKLQIFQDASEVEEQLPLWEANDRLNVSSPSATTLTLIRVVTVGLLMTLRNWYLDIIRVIVMIRCFFLVFVLWWMKY